MQQFCVSLRAGNTVSKYKWVLLLSGCGCAPRPITSLAICIQYETNHICQLGFFPYAILFSQWLISTDVNIPSMMIRSWSSHVPCFWATQILKSDLKCKERSMGGYVAKMFFLQVDEGFWLYWCLIQISKLIFYFSILCSYRLVAELKI